MRTRSAAAFTLSILLGVGCGGGGGGGDGPTVPYTGVTAQAKVSNTNAQDLASLAIGGTDLESVGGFASRRVQGSENPGLVGPAVVGWQLEEVVSRGLQTRHAARAARTVRDSWSEDGPCGGSVSFDIRADDVTGDFSGSISFHNYCDEGLLNGGADFSGSIDMAMGEPRRLTLSFGVLSYQDATDHMSLGGSMTFDFTGYPTTTLSATLNLRDEVAGATYRFEDYVIASTDTGDGADLTLSGRCYHPDHGYVVLRTLTPMHVGWSDLYPSSGAIRGDGDDGTWVLLTAHSVTQCQIEADTDGDGILDWDSGLMPWEAL